MLNFLPSPIMGLLTLTLFSLNTLILCPLLYICATVKLITPVQSVRKKTSSIITGIATAWIEVNSQLLKHTRKVHWDIKGDTDFNPRSSYLVISNHMSWADIFVLQHIFKRKIPFLKFFLKQELIWVPLLGLAWWALEYPFLKRYSKQTLEKHPELKGKDFATTRKQCEKFKESPVCVMNFLEGTRFTAKKHQQQQSPYRHLLKPKTGGVSVVLSNMSNYLNEVIDVTIFYPENQAPITFWDLLAGKVRHIDVTIKRLPLPANTDGKNYSEDAAFRQQMRQWVDQRWEEKDQLIESLTQAHAKKAVDEKQQHQPVTY